MKALLVLTILLTVVMIFLQYKRSRDMKKLSISLISFSVIVSLAVVGNLTRPVIPIFIAHLILLVMAWGGLVWYVVRDRYYWWLIFSPVVTIILFLVMELLVGSGHEKIL